MSIWHKATVDPPHSGYYRVRRITGRHFPSPIPDQEIEDIQEYHYGKSQWILADPTSRITAWRELNKEEATE